MKQRIPSEFLYLYAGGLYYGSRHAVVHTVLGSCVAVTLHAPAYETGAICHAMLPTAPSGGRAEDPRYLDAALARLLGCFAEDGIMPGELQVKAFGGADVLVARQGSSRGATVGSQNIDALHVLLEAHQLSLEASDLGGRCARSLYFDTARGEVLLRRVCGEVSR